MILEIKQLIEEVKRAGRQPSRVYLPPNAYRDVKKHFDHKGKLLGLTVLRCSEDFNRVLVR